MYQRILVPVDGSHTSTLGFTEALRLAKNQHARVRFINVLDELLVAQNYDVFGYGNSGDLLDMLRESGQKAIKAALASAAAHGVKAEASMFESLGGHVAEVIIKEAKKWRADLIVMGTHGRRGINRMFLGSDAEAVLRNTPVPVRLVRPSARKTRARKK
jgi:nucleotide-binding universal stress UspA family protein